MALVISHKMIQAAVYTHIHNNLSVTTTLVYGAEPANLDVNDWIVVWVSRVNRRPQRKGSKDQRWGQILVRCYAKRGTNMYRIDDLVDDVLAVFDQKEIHIKDFATVGKPKLGHLRVFEGDVRDDTREFNEPTRSDVRVEELVFDCYAQED